MHRTCAFRACDNPLPPGAGHGAKYCTENHRKAEHRARKAEREGRVIQLPGTAARPVESDAAAQDDRVNDARELWDLMLAEVRRNGFTVIGASGAAVANPALRYLSAVHLVLRDLEGPGVAVEPEDEYELMKRIAMKRVAEIEAAESARWEAR